VPLTQVIVTAAFVEDPAPRITTLLARLKQQACGITVVPTHVITEIIGERNLGQILGLVKMPEKRSLSDVVNEAPNQRPLFIVAVDVKEPGNIGAMLRTAHAAGASAFVSTGISDPFHPKALRTTMGSLFKLPVVYADQPFPIIRELREMGIESVGMVVSGGISLHKARFSENGTAVFIGSEAWGLPEGVKTAVDRLVSIPMVEEVDSFSVNAAAAIVLYDIGRKWKQP
jgi:TrmH family RNA methyltransferase